MTEDEARKVMQVCNEADSGCFTCASGLLALLTEAFPEHGHTFNVAFVERWGGEG